MNRGAIEQQHNSCMGYGGGGHIGADRSMGGYSAGSAVSDGGMKSGHTAQEFPGQPYGSMENHNGGMQMAPQDGDGHMPDSTGHAGMGTAGNQESRSGE